MLLTDPRIPMVARERKHHDDFVGLTTTPYHARVRRRDILSENAPSPLSPSRAKSNPKESLTSELSPGRSTRKKKLVVSSAKTIRPTTEILFERLSSSFSGLTIRLDMDASATSIRDDGDCDSSVDYDPTKAQPLDPRKKMRKPGSIAVVRCESPVRNIYGFTGSPQCSPDLFKVRAGRQVGNDDRVRLATTTNTARTRGRETSGNASAAVSPSRRAANLRAVISPPPLFESLSSSFSGLTYAPDLNGSSSSLKEQAKREESQEIKSASILSLDTKNEMQQTDASISIASSESTLRTSNTGPADNPSKDAGSTKVASGKALSDDLVELTRTPTKATPRRRETSGTASSSPSQSRRTLNSKNLVSSSDLSPLLERLSSSFSGLSSAPDLDESYSSLKEEVKREMDAMTKMQNEGSISLESVLNGSAADNSLMEPPQTPKAIAGGITLQDSLRIGLTTTPIHARDRRRESSANANSFLSPPRPKSISKTFLADSLPPVQVRSARKKSQRFASPKPTVQPFSRTFSGLTIPLDLDNSSSSLKEESKQKISPETEAAGSQPPDTGESIQTKGSSAIAHCDSSFHNPRSPCAEDSLTESEFATIANGSTLRDELTELPTTPYKARPRRGAVSRNATSNLSPSPTKYNHLKHPFSSTAANRTPLTQRAARKKAAHFFSAKSVRSTTSSLFDRFSTSFSDLTIRLDMDMSFANSTEEAKRDIIREIDTMDRQLIETKKKIEDDGYCAIARFESSCKNAHGPAGNPRGALIAMKKMKRSLLEYKDLEIARDKLHQLLLEVESHNIKVAGYKARMKEILDASSFSDKVEYSNEELLGELMRGEVAKQIEEVCIHALTSV